MRSSLVAVAILVWGCSGGSQAAEPRSEATIQEDVDRALADPGVLQGSYPGSLGTGSSLELYQAADLSSFTVRYVDANGISQARVVAAADVTDGKVAIDGIETVIDSGGWTTSEVAEAVTRDMQAAAATASTTALDPGALHATFEPVTLIVGLACGYGLRALLAQGVTVTFKQPANELSRVQPPASVNCK